VSLRIATWNINSLRLRLPLLRRLVAEVRPDIVCLQETKVPDELFPRAAIEGLGFEHIAHRGMKSYNGVAILSRHPLEAVTIRDACGREDCRHLFARVRGGIELHSVYVPAGGDVPDPAVNEKFAHKLDFLVELTDWWRKRRDESAARIMVGDLNVAPLETDVWSHRQMIKVVSHTPVEVAHLESVARSHDWIDAVRHFVPPERHLYTWWSYRARDWAKSDRGRRLDHIWVTRALADRIERAEVLRAARGWEKPSDHVPVILDLAE